MFFSKNLPLVLSSIVLLFCSQLALEEERPGTCDLPFGSSENYPVIAYDASHRVAYLISRRGARELEEGSKDHHVEIEAYLLSKKEERRSFLCYGRPIEIHAFNRRLKTNYTVTLTAAIAAHKAEITGYTPPSAAAASTGPPATPAAKGLQPIATGANLTTTDQVINDYLNEETFDRALNKVEDDAAAVLAQARQFQANYDDYLLTMDQLIGPDPPADVPAVGNESLRTAAFQFNKAAAGIDDYYHPHRAVDEKTFDDWTELLDRLEVDAARINAKLQDYPTADTLINLHASATTLVDNVRGILAEYQSLDLARKIVLNLLGGISKSTKKPYHNFPDLTEFCKASDSDIQIPEPNYIEQRGLAELRVELRAQYAGTTIDDQTLARILELHQSVTRDLAIRRRLCDSHPIDERDHWSDKISHALKSHFLHDTPLCDHDCLNHPSGPSVEPIDLNFALTHADDQLGILRKAIRDLNQAEAGTFSFINAIYDQSYAPDQVLTLDLSNYGKNLFVFYTLSGIEEFHRYRILNEVPQPVSNCVLSISANVNAAGGQNPCTTTTAAIPQPAATASTSTSVPGASASQPSPPASTTGTQTAAAPAGPPPDYYGHFELHNFSKAGLFTGVAYDSVPNVSFNWASCPTSPSNPTGNNNLTNGPCISPTTPAGTTPPSPTYYQLLKSQGPQIAAIEGISIYPWRPKDTFRELRGSNQWTPDLFVGGAAYPLNHYFLGGNVEPTHGVSLFGGLVFGAETMLPKSYPYQVGSVAVTNPTLPTSTTMKTGVFVGVAFHTSLFGAIFNGSVFQNALKIGSAGSPTPPSSGSQ